MSPAQTVLIADDEAAVRQYLKIVLKKMGVPKVLEATNGVEAVKLFHEGDPDLTILDINMPVMDGLQALTNIRKLNREAKVVMLTAVATKQHVIEAAKKGATSYMRKDLHKNAFTEKLRGFVGVAEATGAG
jgi:CheY-like chemotaxis protein